MPCFYAKFSSHVVQGTCTALDRAEAATCEHYQPGRDGWCQHTLKDHNHVETVPPARPGMRPTYKTKIIRGMVTGECYSAAAAMGKGKG